MSLSNILVRSWPNSIDARIKVLTRAKEEAGVSVIMALAEAFGRWGPRIHRCLNGFHCYTDRKGARGRRRYIIKRIYNFAEEERLPFGEATQGEVEWVLERL